RPRRGRGILVGGYRWRTGSIPAGRYPAMSRPHMLAGRSMKLGPGAEFDRIRRVMQVLGAQGVGLGDDCGLIREGEEFFALSTDVSVEGVHFRPQWVRPDEVGWRATASALSDLAAEGAVPVGILSAV